MKINIQRNVKAIKQAMQLFDHKLAENKREKYQSSHEFVSTMIISLLFFLSMTSEFVLNNTHTHTHTHICFFIPEIQQNELC